jgi:PAS domain S-box-containing protein
VWLDTLGYSREEVIGKSFDDFLHPNSVDHFREKFPRFKAVGEVLGIEFEMVRKDGSIIAVSFNGEIGYDKQGRFKQTYCIFQDITDRKQTQDILRKSEGKFKTLAEQSPNMIFINKQGRVVYANKKCEKITGYKRKEFYSPDFDFLILIAPEYREKVWSNFGRHLRGEEVEPYEYVLLAKDGRRIEILLSTKLIDYDEEKAILGILTDITDRKRAEESLRRAHEELELRVEERTAKLAQSKNQLEEVNTALRVLLKQREGDKTELEEKVLSNVKDLILPYVEKLKRTSLDSDQKPCVDILESNLKEIVSPFSRKLTSKYLGLTATEIRVANLVKEGKKTKYIAEFMNVSGKTIEFHRDNIRKKLGLKNRKINLRTHLLSI